MQETPATASQASNMYGQHCIKDLKPFELTFDSESDLDFDKHFRQKKASLPPPKKELMYKSVMPVQQDSNLLARQIRIRSLVPLSMTDRLRGNPYELQFDRMLKYSTSSNSACNFLALRSAFLEWTKQPSLKFYLIRKNKIWQFLSEKPLRRVLLEPADHQSPARRYCQKEILLRLQHLLEDVRNAQVNQYEIYAEFMFQGCCVYTPSSFTRHQDQQRGHTRLRNEFLNRSCLQTLKGMRQTKEYELSINGLVWAKQLRQIGEWLAENEVQYNIEIIRGNQL